LNIIQSTLARCLQLHWHSNKRILHLRQDSPVNPIPMYLRLDMKWQLYNRLNFLKVPRIQNNNLMPILLQSFYQSHHISVAFLGSFVTRNENWFLDQGIIADVEELGFAGGIIMSCETVEAMK